MLLIPLYVLFIKGKLRGKITQKKSLIVLSFAK